MQGRSGSGLAAGLGVALLYAVHLLCCQSSALPFLDAAYTSSDMHTNLLWAHSIQEQGWLNPKPYHPYFAWMQAIAPYAQWAEWWHGEQIFQQSPLYAYLLAAILPKAGLMRVAQALISMATCAALGLLAARLATALAGWIAFALAALYAPYFAYSWPFLRDGLGWFLTAAVLWSLSALGDSDWTTPRARRLAGLTGLLLGLGYLAKETFLLLIPATLGVLAYLAWKRRAPLVIAWVAAATVLAIAPLMVRNLRVGAPLLSTSNRFAETFVHGNAGSAKPFTFSIPKETGPLLRETHAETWPLIRATVASHPDGFVGWLGLQVKKLLALLDPYESPDNLSVYFMATLSPLVRFGLRYWMILVPAIAGLARALLTRDRRHLWMAVYAPAFLASLVVGVTVSRYRQSLSVFLIPWAACFLAWMVEEAQQRQFSTVARAGLALVGGWLLVLGPLARQPRSDYERSMEYLLAARIYDQHGDEARFDDEVELIHRKFPDLAL